MNSIDLLAYIDQRRRELTAERATYKAGGLAHLCIEGRECELLRLEIVAKGGTVGAIPDPIFASPAPAHGTTAPSGPCDNPGK